jgi:hypothetical protein
MLYEVTPILNASGFPQEDLKARRSTTEPRGLVQQLAQAVRAVYDRPSIQERSNQASLSFSSRVTGYGYLK